MLNINPLLIGAVSNEDIDLIIDRICSTLLKHYKNIPTLKFRKNQKPFWNEHLSHLKRVKVAKFKLWKDAGRPREDSNCLFTAHKTAKKDFAREIRRVSRSYENEQVLQTIESAEVNRNAFWKIVKRSRNSHGCGINTIRVSKDTVVHEKQEILSAFKSHFEKVSTPKNDAAFDNEHFDAISQQVKGLNKLKDSDQFLDKPFTIAEVQKAIDKLHFRKGSGYDGISSEHVKFAGPVLVRILTLLYNLVVSSEYIPVNFRRGVQVPLYKGKNQCVLDMNNYRGITLLTNFNKIFEILVWGRLETWWLGNGIISNLQGACRKGQSCIHTVFLLQETVSTALKRHKSVFVAFYDVSKAFDTVWTDGLFSKLYDMGITGKVWRLF